MAGTYPKKTQIVFISVKVPHRLRERKTFKKIKRHIHYVPM